MPNIPVEGKKIGAFCRRWSISELALCGSALRADFGPESDTDVLIQFFPEAEPSLFDMVRMQEE